MARPLAASTVSLRPALAPRESPSLELAPAQHDLALHPHPRDPPQGPARPSHPATRPEARSAWLHALAADPRALAILVDRLPPRDSQPELGYLVPRLIERLADGSSDPPTRDTHLRLLARIGTPHARAALAHSLEAQALPCRSAEVLRAQLQAAAHVLLGVDGAALYARLAEVVRAIGARGEAGEVREAAAALSVLARHPDLRARAAQLLRSDLGLTHPEPLAAGSLALAAHALQLDEREALTAQARPRLRALGSPAALTLERELAARTLERGSVLAFFLGRRTG